MRARNVRMKYLFLLIPFGSLFTPPSVWAADITYVGDSQSASPGGLFAKLRGDLEKQGEIKNARAVCGATIGDYEGKGHASRCHYTGITHLDWNHQPNVFQQGGGRTANLESLMKDANTVIIELGDNHLDDAGIGAKAKGMARKVLESGKKCIWIGPASVPPTTCAVNFAKKKKTSEAIKNVLSTLQVRGRKCEFINSFEATKSNPPASRDCLHYSNYNTWANAIRTPLTDALATEAGPSTNSPPPPIAR